MKYSVVFAPEARGAIAALYSSIASASSAETAARSTEGVVAHCESLSTFPNRGAKREDVRSELRITAYKKRVVIAFVVDKEQVSILGVLRRSGLQNKFCKTVRKMHSVTAQRC